MSRSHWWEDRAAVMRAFPPPIPHRMESMRGPNYTNWVIKNHVLMGPHPGQVSTTDMVKNLTQILEAGVTTFVCLQHEMPTPNIAKKSGAEPSSRARSSFGSGVVVHAKPYIDDAQIIAEHARMPQVSADRPLTFLHLPIHDSNGATTSDDSLSEFVTALMSHIKAGEVLYLQCGDGDGRSGTLAALILGLVYDLSSSEALDLTQRCRAYRFGTEGSSPDTHEQKMQVHRLLAREGFRSKARSVPAKSSCEVVKNPEAEVGTILRNIRTQLSRQSPSAFMKLRDRFAATGDRSRNLSPAEFTRVLNAAGVRLTDDETRIMLVAFHTRRPPTHAAAAPATLVLDSVPFLSAVRGHMNDMRQELVRQAYSTFQPDPRAGFINTSSVARVYSGASHPDVKAGRRTEAEIVSEFLDSFKVRSNTEGRVTLQDFMEYYADVSASIDDDNYFQLMMWNAWPFKTRSATGTSAGKASRADDSGSWDARRAAAAGAGGAATSPDEVLAKARAAAGALGDFGVAKLGQALTDQDLNHDGWVTQEEFGNALAVLKLPLTREEVGVLFAAGRPERGYVAVDMFMSMFTGRLSAFRRKLVLAAFNRLDTDGVGRVPLPVVTAQFKADKHPAVTASRARPEAILRDFLKTFSDGVVDDMVTLPHFERFYEGVSVALPSDDDFQVTVWNTWDLSAPRTPLRGAATPETSYARAREGDEGFFGSLDRLNAAARRPSPQVKPQGKAMFHAHPAQTQSAAVVGSPGAHHTQPAPPPPPPPPADEMALLAKGDRGRRLDFNAHAKLYSPSGVVLQHEGEAGDDVARMRAAFQHHALVGPSTPSRASTSTGSSPSRVKTAIRRHCASRGVKGVLALERKLQSVGRGNPYIPSKEFVNALRDHALPLGPDDYTMLLEDQDPSGRGYVDARAFIRDVRGQLMGHRLELVESAFRQVDTNGSGAVDMNELRMHYNSREHPDVKSGKRTEAEVLREFLETCDIGRDGSVSLQEFLDYYAAVSATIDDDNYFQMLVWSTWNLKGSTSGVGASPARKNVAAGVSATAAVEYHLSGAKLAPTAVSAYQGLPPTRRDAPASADAVDIDGLIARLREAFSRRGIHGIVELGRSFRITDRDRTGSIDLDELGRVMKLYGLGLSATELEALFRYYDRDGSGLISFKEFLRGFRGSLPAARRELIQKAFRKMDVDGSGAIEVTDIALCFNPRSNQDVLSGKLTERDALRKFLDEFDSFDRDGRVTLEEFEDYYANISATIDDDSYFQLLLWTSWQLDKPNPRAGAAAGAGRR